MTQEIKIEVDDHNFTIAELMMLTILASTHPTHNLRVHDDPTNIKVYIGSYYTEKIRYWVEPDGNVGLAEQDISDPSDEDADWVFISLPDAKNLLKTDLPHK